MRIKKNFRGQAVVEFILIAPFLVFLTLFAVRVGEYFYSHASSQALVYSAGMVFSRTGDPFLSNFGIADTDPVEKSLRVWNAAKTSVTLYGTPSNFSGKCYMSFLVIKGNLLTGDFVPNGDWDNMFAQASSISEASAVFARPLFGGWPIFEFFGERSARCVTNSESSSFYYFES